MGRYDPIAYTYEADVHCTDCTLARFGRDAAGWIAGAGAIDSEGNTPGVIAPWDDEDDLACGDCGAIIREPRASILLRDASPDRLDARDIARALDAGALDVIR